MHRILKKWVEPYVLLETLKKHYEIKDFTFDGYSKNTVKKEFLKSLKKENTLGLYMKNVNKFYLFTSEGSIDLDKIFNFTQEDYEVTDDINKPFEFVDIGKAEAGFIIL